MTHGPDVAPSTDDGGEVAAGYDGWPLQRKMALISEVGSAAALLSYGETMLRTTRGTFGEMKDPVLTTLSIGLEKLLKLTIGLITLTDTEEWPTKTVMQNKFRHDIAGMHQRVIADLRQRSDSRPYVLQLLDTATADPVLDPMIALLSDYGRSGRFYYLDHLADGSAQDRPDPVQLWQEAEDALRDDPEVVKLFNDGLAARTDDGWERFIHYRNTKLADCVASLRAAVVASWAHGCAGPVARQHSVSLAG